MLKLILLDFGYFLNFLTIPTHFINTSRPGTLLLQPPYHLIMPSATPDYSLSEEQKQHFLDYGFVKLGWSCCHTYFADRNHVLNGI